MSIWDVLLWYRSPDYPRVPCRVERFRLGEQGLTLGSTFLCQTTELFAGLGRLSDGGTPDVTVREDMSRKELGKLD